MNRWLIPALLAVLLIASLLSLICGTVWLTPGELFAGLADPHPSLAGMVLTEIRLPRLALGILIGAILGLAGAVLQGLLRNPLAEPGLLGVAGGASLGAVIAIYFGFTASFALASPIFALIGAMITAGIAFALARGGGTLSLILAGTAISSIAFAGVYLALNLAPNPYAAYEMTTWLMGSLQDRSWDHVQLAAPFILFGGSVLLFTGRALDAMALGEVQAESLGVDIGRVRLLTLVGTAFGVGAATAVTGAVSFVGLLAPHLVRPLVGYRPAATLVPAGIAGAILVVVADICTRLIHIGPPIQLGVFISLVGAPFFLWLVLHVRGRTA
ncbi:iron ABC transporter permease [Sphingomonas sp. KR3-1]|uniref:FecCD family ABC transporter permease n=1 Tax=Sphingomonas sp. KR3-1 TaxID=3156611 RepID=UPI0032B418FA